MSKKEFILIVFVLAFFPLLIIAGFVSTQQTKDSEEEKCKVGIAYNRCLIDWATKNGYGIENRTTYELSLKDCAFLNPCHNYN